MPMILAAFLVIALGTTACFWFLKKKHSKPAPPEPVATELLRVEPFVVNLADDNHTYLRIGVDMAIEREGTHEEKAPDKASSAVRDAVITVLTAQESSVLLTAEGKRRLREELQKRVNEQVAGIKVHEVYFTEFLLQR